MTETVKPLGARVYEIYLKNLERTPGLDPKEALADAYRKVNPQKDIQDFMSDVDDSLWYKKNIRKKIHDLIEAEDITLEQFRAKQREPVGKPTSLRERWKQWHFYAPDLSISQAATGGATTSSNVDWIGYDNRHLRVRFKEKTSKKTGKVYPASMYEYDVEPKFLEAMAAASSKGKFVWNYLRGHIPGRVIDQPWKITPGGVGGSIVPYSKESPRMLPARQMKRIRKKFGKEITRGTRLVEMSSARAKQIMKVSTIPKISPGQTALIQKLEKRYKRDLEVSDYPVREYKRGSGSVKSHTRGENQEKYHQIEKINKQTKEVIQWVKENNLEFEITHGKGGEYGDLRLDVSKGYKSVEIRIFPIGKSIDISIWKEKGYHSSIKSLKDISLSRGFNYIKEHFGLKQDLEDLDIKGYTRTDPKTGKKIEVGQYSRKGEAKKEILKKIKGLQKSPLPEPKGKKKGLTPEEKKRKEIEHQARGIKKQPAPDKREEAVQKLIEQTGYDRKRAEAEISKQFGPSKEEVATKEKQKKVQERTQQQVKQKQQQLQHSVLKLQILNQRNFKSEALKDILQLFADLLTGKGKNIIQASRRFKRNYTRLQRDQRISLQKKSALLGVINRLNTEIQGLSAPQKDFEIEDVQKGKGWHGETERHSEAAKKGQSSTRQSEQNKIDIRKEKARIRKEIKEVEEEEELLSMALLGTSNAKEESPGIYTELQRAKAKLGRLKLELKMTPEQLKKLRIHYGMGVSGAELTRAYKGLPGKKEDFEVSDYPVKGYYSMRGKPPKRIFTRRHTREEGKSIQEKPRLTSEIVQYRHKISTDIPLWRKIKRWRKKSIVLTEKIEEAEKKGDLRMRNLYIQQLAYYRMLRHIPTREAIESTIGYYKNNKKEGEK